jgi:hypothetical protein
VAQTNPDRRNWAKTVHFEQTFSKGKFSTYSSTIQTFFCTTPTTSVSRRRCPLWRWFLAPHPRSSWGPPVPWRCPPAIKLSSETQNSMLVPGPAKRALWRGSRGSSPQCSPANCCQFGLEHCPKRNAYRRRPCPTSSSLKSSPTCRGPSWCAQRWPWPPWRRGWCRNSLRIKEVQGQPFLSLSIDCCFKRTWLSFLDWLF